MPDIDQITRAEEFQGMLVEDVATLPSQARQQLFAAIPHLQQDRCRVVALGDTPPSVLEVLLKFLGGAALLLLAGRRVVRTLSPSAWGKEPRHHPPDPHWPIADPTDRPRLQDLT